MLMEQLAWEEKVEHSLKVAAIQMISGKSVEDNLDSAGKLITEAASKGAELIVLPEFFIRIANAADIEFREIIEPLGAGSIQARLSAMAKKNKIFLVAGTIPIKSEYDKKCYNTALVYNPEGILICHYHKIHLFKFDNKEYKFDESAAFTYGDKIGKFTIGGFTIGLAICYDLRFPELFRSMAGVDAFVLPAAFLHHTGVAHWEILLRARAIENQAYVIASGQGGVHDNGRHTFGHSMLINPWGEVESVLETGVGIVIGTLKKSTLDKIRHELPALNNRRI
ncbi:MAG: acyltransferase [Burkholderiales bacterium]|jgi:nitrilase|nr:acyltransferase [Burkholderiales bacterium]